MQYTLMHKDISVADIEIDNATGVVARIGAVYDAQHIPVGVAINHHEPDRRELNDWWIGRSIPASRQGIREALEKLGMTSSQLLIDKCMGLSLSDQYWIRPQNATIQWSQVNFFENPFSEDVGNLLFGATPNLETISLMSPDNTSDGWLKKKWMIVKGKRYLVKGGSNPFRQEPLNEALASEIMRRLDIPHVPYSVKWEHDEPFCVCENFLTPQTELIGAWHITQTMKRPNHVSAYQHFIDCCVKLGITDVEEALAQMLAVDFLIANEDRHLHNFGAVRNAETLEWIGIAPIYDSGTSMWFDAPNSRIGAPGKSKPFRATHDEQIKLATSLDFVDFAALSDIADVAREIYGKSPLIDADRKDRLCRAVASRVKLLEKEQDSRPKPSLLGKLEEAKSQMKDRESGIKQLKAKLNEHDI